MKPIVIGCDNAAVELKNVLIGVLKEEGRSFENVGVDSAEDQTGYPVIAQRVAEKIIASNYAQRGYPDLWYRHRHGDHRQQVSRYLCRGLP